jgi:hypothetical protein
VNILNKQPRIADKGGSPAWGLGEKLTTPHCENKYLLRNIYKQNLGAGWGGGRRGIHEVLWESRGERNHWGDPGVDGRIILGWIFRKWDVGYGLYWAGSG